MNILVDAYMNRNFGDDLLIYELVRYYPEHSFYIFAESDYLQLFPGLNNLFTVPPILPSESNYWKRGVNKVRSFFGLPKHQIVKFWRNNHFDVYLQYGGSIFMQVTKRSWKNKISDYKYAIKHNQLNAVMDCNFGPYSSTAFLESHRELFSLFDLVTFRDTYSYGLFADLATTRCGADISLREKIDPSIQCIEPSGDNKTLFVSPIDVSWRNGLGGDRDKYLSNLAELVVAAANQMKLDVKVAPFCEGEGDVRAGKELVDQIVQRSDGSIAPALLEYTDVPQYLEEMASSSLVIGSRFHAIIPALALSVPVIPISYSKKSMMSSMTWNSKA